MQEPQVYIILTGVHERKVFDLFNILRKNHRHYELILFDHKDCSVSLPLLYGRKVNKLPNTGYPAFEKALLKTLDSYAGSKFVYIPLLDDYNGLFYQFIETHPERLCCLLPPVNSFNIASHKIQFQQFCNENDFAAPRSFTKDDVPYLKQHFVPLIIKPNRGSGAVGVSFINTINELSRLNNIDFDNYLVQRRIDNTNVEGAFFLMNKGELITYYGHKRLRVFPETGGVTVYSEYRHNEKLKETGTALLKKMQWHGLAMIEFLYDADSGEYKVIELNPRLWGSFLLSEFANTGMTENYISASLGGSTKEFVHKPVTRIRWFYPFDIFLFIKRKGKISHFFKLDRRHTCYINVTYAGFLRSVLYVLYFTFNINSIKRFFQKLRP